MFPKRPRLNASLYRGLQSCFLTFCTDDRQQFFNNSQAVGVVLDQILHVAPLCSVAIVAYCFMPDHLHLLVTGETNAADALTFAHQARQRSAFAFKQKWRVRLWQPSFYDRVLRDEDARISVARYIVENPVRARIVEAAGDYPFIGSDRYTIEQMLDAVCWQP